MASTLTLRFLNSFVILAIAPSSVVQTGVKSFGCENRMPQPVPSHSWKLTVPSVVCAVKFGASSPSRSAIGRGSRQRRRDDGQEEETENIYKTGGTSLRCTKADSQRQAEEDCQDQEGRAQETGRQQSETESTAASHAGSQGGAHRIGQGCPRGRTFAHAGGTGGGRSSRRDGRRPAGGDTLGRRGGRRGLFREG